MTDRYILDGKTPVPCEDLIKWALWLENSKRHVGSEIRGNVRVSTVFLGIDHRYPPAKGPPLLFETMVFGGEHDQDMGRCSTWDEAEKMHREFCARVWPDA